MFMQRINGREFELQLRHDIDESHAYKTLLVNTEGYTL
jgi:hypothetical protein